VKRDPSTSSATNPGSMRSRDALEPGTKYDDDVLHAAAWLHDIGVFAGHRPEDPEQLAVWDNAAYAVERAPTLLQNMGFPTEKVDAVVEAIRTHQVPAHPVTIEGVIIRDADILEQIGGKQAVMDSATLSAISMLRLCLAT